MLTLERRVRALERSLVCRVVGAIGVASLGLTGCGLDPASRAATGGSARGGVALIVAPDDGTTEIVDAMRTARQRLLVEMYMLTAADALSALLAARARGVDVRVLLEPAPYGDATANLPAFATLAGAGVDVRWTQRPNGLVHAKLIVVDGVRVYVLTLNLTEAGLASNREYAVTDGDPTEVKWAETVWNADAIGGDPGRAPGHVRLLVSPVDARPRLSAAIDGADTSLAIEIEELSDSDLITHLTAARGRGVAITVVAPALNRSAATTTALGKLAAAGAVVQVLVAPVVHAKAMVIDHLSAYVGSMNFTRASLDDNREFGLLLTDPKVTARLSTRIAADASAATPFR